MMSSDTQWSRPIHLQKNPGNDHPLNHTSWLTLRQSLKIVFISAFWYSPTLCHQRYSANLVQELWFVRDDLSIQHFRHVWKAMTSQLKKNVGVLTILCLLKMDSKKCISYFANLKWSHYLVLQPNKHLGDARWGTIRHKDSPFGQLSPFAGSPVGLKVSNLYKWRIYH